MSAIRSKGNKDTELKLISIFRDTGLLGWRGSKLFGKPDFVFRRERLCGVCGWLFLARMSMALSNAQVQA